MRYRDTVAVIGATGSMGSFICKGLADGPYRLLLADLSQEKLLDLQQQISSSNKQAETDIISCCKDASWEADIIIIAVEEKDKEKVALLMRDVANCKIVVNVTTSLVRDLAAIEIILPYSKLVEVYFSLPEQSFENIRDIEVFLTSNDRIAVETAGQLITTIGCKPVKITETV